VTDSGTVNVSSGGGGELLLSPNPAAKVVNIIMIDSIRSITLNKVMISNNKNKMFLNFKQ